MYIAINISHPDSKGVKGSVAISFREVNYLVTAPKDSGGPLIVEDDKNNRHIQGNLLRGTLSTGWVRLDLWYK